MTQRQAWILELLSRPFEDGYVRDHHLKIEGKDDRFRLLAVLPNRHFAWTKHERDEELLRDR